MVTRALRLTGTSRTTPIGSFPRVSGARRPRVPSGLRAPRPLCRSSSRQAFVRETPNAAARGCVRRRRTQPVGGRGDTVQRVEKEPLVFQGSSPRFDHGVRKLELREGQNPAQQSRGDEVVDLGIHILDARVRQQDWWRLGRRRAPSGVEQHGHYSPAQTLGRPATPRSVERSCRSPQDDWSPRTHPVCLRCHAWNVRSHPRAVNRGTPSSVAMVRSAVR